MKSLCVEGWRFIPHSYAMVNQWQLLSLLKRKDISLSVRDLPFFRDSWQRTKGLFDLEDESRLAAIPTLAAEECSDVTFRMAFPYDFTPVPKGRTVIFGTSENKFVDETMLARPADIKSLSNSGSFCVITPSRWSREGFLRIGLREDQVVVVPHGVANNVFRPLRSTRTSIRKKLRLSGFTFSNTSAMVPNKGIDILLRAFAVVAEKRPDVHLLLKGVDALYGSSTFVQQAIAALPASIRSVVFDRIRYFGNTISVKSMAEFYRAADAYVSPYFAEGFNLPVLEALACGTPVICTKGGSTDDFLDERHALFIDSKLEAVRFGAGTSSSSGVQLVPNIDHLIQLMFRIMDDDAWRRKASIAGARHAAAEYNWDKVVEKLMASMFIE